MKPAIGGAMPARWPAIMAYTIIRGRLISVDDAEFERRKEHADQKM